MISLQESINEASAMAQIEYDQQQLTKANHEHSDDDTRAVWDGEDSQSTQSKAMQYLAGAIRKKATAFPVK